MAGYFRANLEGSTVLHVVGETGPAEAVVADGGGEARVATPTLDHMECVSPVERSFGELARLPLATHLCRTEE